MKETTLATKGKDKLTKCDFDDGEPIYAVSKDKVTHTEFTCHYTVQSAVSKLIKG